MMMIDRRVLLAAAAGVLTAAAVPVHAADLDAGTLAQRFAQTLSEHDMTGFAALIADDYVNHQMSAAAPAPPAGLSAKQASVNFFSARLTGIPDLSVSIEVLVASGDRVAASFVYSGVQSGPLYGVAPTGKHLRFSSCDIFRVQNGQISEHWGMGDIAGVLAQLHAA